MEADEPTSPLLIHQNDLNVLQKRDSSPRPLRLLNREPRGIPWPLSRLIQ